MNAFFCNPDSYLFCAKVLLIFRLKNLMANNCKTTVFKYWFSLFTINLQANISMQQKLATRKKISDLKIQAVHYFFLATWPNSTEVFVSNLDHWFCYCMFSRKCFRLAYYDFKFSIELKVWVCLFWEKIGNSV